MSLLIHSNWTTELQSQQHLAVDGSPRWEYLLLFIIPFGTIWGNVFVCLAVYLERRLRHRFNLFLVSLAISDLLCAILVMPVSAWHMIVGRNDRDLALCLVWYSLDIFFTATTIIHLCNISLDRYLALRKPFGSVRTRPHPLNSLTLRIILSWLISFSIAGPLFLFALKQQEQQLEVLTTTTKTTTPKTNTSIRLEPTHYLDESADSTASYKGCGPNDPSFVLTAIGITFVLPLIIMITTYVLTVQTLKQHMQQIQAIQLYATQRANHHPRPGQLNRPGAELKPGNRVHLAKNSIMMSELMSAGDTTTTYANSQAILKSLDRTKCRDRNGLGKNLTVNSTKAWNNHNNNDNGGNDDDDDDDGGDEECGGGDDSQTQVSYSNNLIKLEFTNHETLSTSSPKKNHPTKNGTHTIHKVTHDPESSNSLEMNDEQQTLVPDQTMTQSHCPESLNPSGRPESGYLTVCSDDKPNSPTGRKSIRASFRWNFKSPNPLTNLSRTNTTTTTQSENRLTMDRIHKGKRAVRVIGVLFGVFMTCYLPFFIVYIIDVLCPSCNAWTGPIMAHLEWLGYLSSMLNPFVYHSFNPTFRRTFRRMMRCACCRKHRRHEHYAIWRRRIRL